MAIDAITHRRSRGGRGDATEDSGSATATVAPLDTTAHYPRLVSEPAPECPGLLADDPHRIAFALADAPEDPAPCPPAATPGGHPGRRGTASRPVVRGPPRPSLARTPACRPHRSHERSGRRPTLGFSGPHGRACTDHGSSTERSTTACGADAALVLDVPTPRRCRRGADRCVGTLSGRGCRRGAHGPLEGWLRRIDPERARRVRDRHRMDRRVRHPELAQEREEAQRQVRVRRHGTPAGLPDRVPPGVVRQQDLRLEPGVQQLQQRRPRRRSRGRPRRARSSTPSARRARAGRRRSPDARG